MIKFICFLFLFLFIASGVFAVEFEVTGIIFQKEPLAIINGKIVKVGEKINGAVVDRIFDNTVFLKYKGDIIIKNVSGKCLGQDVEADINKKPHKVKPSKKNPFFFLLVLIFILAGAGFYLSRKNKGKDAPVQ